MNAHASSPINTRVSSMASNSTASSTAASTTRQSPSNQPAPVPAQMKTASTDPFLKDFTLIAEAARRAELAVMMRDFEDCGIS